MHSALNLNSVPPNSRKERRTVGRKEGSRGRREERKKGWEEGKGGRRKKRECFYLS
jgi:hypothetical protein